MRHGLVLLCLFAASPAAAQYFSNVPNVLSNAGPANAGEVNDNFTALVLNGNAVFNTFEAEIAALGVASVPTGMVLPFNLSACPTGWLTADGSSGTIDMRGRFARGTTVSASVGTGQGDQFLDHSQTITATPAVITDISGSAVTSDSNEGTINRTFTQIVVGLPVAPARFGTETRPKNVALRYCEKV